MSGGRQTEGFTDASGLGASVLYAVVRAVINGAARVWFRLSIEGTEKLPTGPFVLAPIHRSNLDTLILARLPRRLRFMGKDSLWKWWGGWFLSALGAFPVARGQADRDALHKAIEVVEAGQPVLIFPEGTRQTGPEVKPLFDGAAYVAGRCQVPIVPLGIGGSEAAMPKGKKFIRPAKIHMVVGDPLDPPELKGNGRVSRTSTRARTEDLSKSLQALFDHSQRVSSR